MMMKHHSQTKTEQLVGRWVTPAHQRRGGVRVSECLPLKCRSTAGCNQKARRHLLLLQRPCGGVQGRLTITIQHPSSAVALWWWLRNREASECKSRGRSPTEGRLRGFAPFMTWSLQTRDPQTHTRSVPFACDVF